MKDSIRVRIPATTANVGPGFDSLGIALRLYNTMDLKLSVMPRIVYEGPIPAKQSHGAIKMIMEAARAFFHSTKLEEQGLTVRMSGDVPVARGLGSSVTVRLGIVGGLNQLLGKRLGKHGVLEIVAALEGHPDNAAPAIYGGFTVAGMFGDRVMCLRQKLSKDLKLVAAIPDFEVETKKARELLPVSLPFADAVHNVNRVSLLVAALWSGNYKAAGDFLEDRLHQPYRTALVPQLFTCLNAAKLAGAIGGWLSGSGSTIMAITLTRAGEVGRAMQKVFEDTGRSCSIMVTEVDQEGITYGKVGR